MPDWQKDTLTGDWNGLRTKLYDKGFNFSVLHDSDFFANVSGGLKRGSGWMGRTDTRLDIDLEKAAGWHASTASIKYRSDLGAKINRDYVGGVVGVDIIEANTNTAQLLEGFVQKNFADDRFSVLAGLYQLDSEFYVTDTSTYFVPPQYGMANELAITGKNGIPLGVLAIRLKAYSPNKNFYVQAALTDGVPGDPNNPHGTHIKLAKGDGTFSIVEFVYSPQPNADPEAAENPGDKAKEKAGETKEEAEDFNKTAIGFWRYSGQFDAIDGLGGHGKSYGAYFLSEKTLFKESGSQSRGLAGFVRFGLSSDKVNLLDWSGSAGLRYRGLISGRDDDIAAIAVTVNHASKDFRSTANFERQETDIEMNYRAQIKPWLAIQPSIQGIINPGLDPSIDNAWLLGTRVEIAL